MNTADRGPNEGTDSGLIQMTGTSKKAQFCHIEVRDPKEGTVVSYR